MIGLKHILTHPLKKDQAISSIYVEKDVSGHGMVFIGTTTGDLLKYRVDIAGNTDISPIDKPFYTHRSLLDELSSHTLSPAITSICSYDTGTDRHLLIVGGERILTFISSQVENETQELQCRNNSDEDQSDSNNSGNNSDKNSKISQSQNGLDIKKFHLLSPHMYDIHSLCITNQYLITSDYFTIEMSNLENISSHFVNLPKNRNSINTLGGISRLDTYTILNTKNSNSMITCAKLIDSDTLSYGTTNGTVHLIDLRCNEEIRKYQIDCELGVTNVVYDMTLLTENEGNNSKDTNGLAIRTVNKVVELDLRKETIQKEVELFKVEMSELENMREWMYERRSIVEYLYDDVVRNPVRHSFWGKLDSFTETINKMGLFTQHHNGDVLFCNGAVQPLLKNKCAVMGVWYGEKDFIWMGGDELNVFEIEKNH